MDCAAISLSRIATHARPVGERSRLAVSQSPAMRNGQAQEVEGHVAGERDAEDDRLVHRAGP